MSRRKVREVMTTEVLAVAVDTPVSELAALMAATGLRTVPVLGANGRVAGLVTTSPEAPLAEAARSMSRNQLSELPVADSCGHLVGVVSWADLGHGFLRADCDLVHEIIRDVFVRHLGTDPSLVRVGVQDGLATLSGSVAAKSMIPLAVAMCRGIDGVVNVVSYLAYATDDTAAQPGAGRPSRTASSGGAGSRAPW